MGYTCQHSDSKHNARKVTRFWTQSKHSADLEGDLATPLQSCISEFPSRLSMCDFSCRVRAQTWPLVYEAFWCFGFFFPSFPRVNHLDEGQKKSHTLNVHMTSTCCKGQLLCRRQYARQGKWVMGFMGFKAREALGLPTGHSYPWLKRKRFRVFSRVPRL